MDRNGRDARLALLAKRQAGAFSFAQAVQLGYPASTIGRRLAKGAWERRLPGVYVLGGAPVSWRQDLWVAVLATGPDAVLSHETAALIHGAERLSADPITLTVPHGARQQIAGVTIHQIDDLVDQHRQMWHDLPVSRPARSVVELAATQTAVMIGRVADDLVRMNKTTYVEIGRVLAQVTRPGKPGLAKVATALDERSDGHIPTASELEHGLFSALDAGGLPAPKRQIPLPGRGPVKGIADAGYEDAKIVLEADGRRWHARVEAARRDRERDAQVVRAGWVPLRFLHEQIVGHPEEVCAIVADTRAVRLALFDPRAA